MKLKILVLVMLMSLGVLGVMMPSGSVHAQGAPKPTPTNEATESSEESGQSGDGNGSHQNYGQPPLDTTGNRSMGAMVSGVVFNYSTASPQGGIVVRLQGNGWQGETTTDGNGFYQFTGLSYGQGTLKAQLPPGAVAVTPDWEVKLVPGQSQVVNLGYYLSNLSPLPVRVSAHVTGTVLYIQVVNTLSETITNGRLEVRLPSGREALPTMKSSLGAIMYGVTTQRVQLDSLMGGAKVAIEIPFRDTAQSQSPAGVMPAAYHQGEARLPTFRVSFVYDQQVTPQLLILATNGTFLNQVAGVVTPTITTTANLTAAVGVTATMITTTVPISQPPVLMPTTGFEQSYSAPTFMGLLLGIGLVVSGWWSVRARR